MNRHFSRSLRGVVLALSAATSIGSGIPVATAVTATSAAAATTPVVQVASHPSSKPAKLRDPRANLVASPDFHTLCASDGPQNASCIAQALGAINKAHVAEGVRRMILPTDYKELTIPEQTFVVTNLERVDRGMRPFLGLAAKLNPSARQAAVAHDDPTLIGALLTLLGVREYASIWAGDFGPLASDYDWMYDDGYSANGSINIDCKQPGQSGCWGHRHAILGLFSGLPTLIAGGGSAGPGGGSIAEVLVGSLLHAPALTYTWADALAHGANGHKVTAA
ncbi:MAG TPA: hypothetical protein VG899_04485 [Mycobacteriales bacterium]|nr:hypothetical protein [Mycobacteriales bacterium]